MRAGQRATTAEGRSGTLGRLLVGPGGRREATVTLDAMARGGAPGPAVAVRAVRPEGREPVIVATNRPDARALAAYRKRWAIECFFADAKTRGLNLEDTRLTAPRKLALLVAILVIAIAWAGATADGLLGRPPRRERRTATRRSPSSASASTASEDRSEPPPRKPSTRGTNAMQPSISEEFV